MLSAVRKLHTMQIRTIVAQQYDCSTRLSCNKSRCCRSIEDVFEWQWQNNSGAFASYDAHAQALIEAAYQASRLL